MAGFPRAPGDDPPAAVRPSARTIFGNHVQSPSRVPEWAWDLIRCVALVVWVGVAALLVFSPDLGLSVLWGVVVPIVPALLVLAPGLWRQVCPLAFANQTPRRLGWSKGRALPVWLERRAFTIAILLFGIAISLRSPVLDHLGWAAGALLIASLVAAFAGGLVFKGRSGWCGTFCPLGPIQRVYGQAPVVEVAQSYCAPCVGCQKNCYDFSPRAAVFDDIYDENPGYAGERRLFFAGLPGLLLGFFLTPFEASDGYGLHALTLLGATLVSVGVYQALTSFFPVSPYRAAAAFSAVALIVYYAFSGPVLLATVHDLLQAEAPSVWALTASRATGCVFAAALLTAGLANEGRFRKAWFDAREAARAGMRRRHWLILEGVDEPVRVEHDQTLLNALAGSGCAIEGQCGVGQCGADAVEILEGLGNLTPPGPDEAATLARLGHGPATRLACCARVRGPVSLRRAGATSEKPDARKVPPARRAASGIVPPDRFASVAGRVAQQQRARLDPARLAGLDHVLIVGNGIAGETVAEELRKASPSVGITLLAQEATGFYKRIAVGGIVSGDASPEQLRMRPDGWHAERGIALQLGVSAVSIDRGRRMVRLSDGRDIAYDKIVLATGARPRLPAPDFTTRRNGFVLHGLDDAKLLRACVEAGTMRSAVVLGGGVLAVETAEMFARIGLRTTVVCRSPRLMADLIDGESASLLQRYLERLGVSVLAETALAGWRGADAFDAALLHDGSEICGDMFVACIGVEPNVDLARSCGLDVRRGIVVDATMATTDPDIFAVGDVAEREGRQSGQWASAAAGARTAASALLCAPVDHVPPRGWLKLKSGGIDLRVFGSLEPKEGDEVIVAPPFEPAWWRVVLRNGLIVGAVHAGPPGSSSPLWALAQNAALSEAGADVLRSGDLAVLEDAGL